MTESAQAWGGRRASESERPEGREQLLELGVRMFLATVTMLFAAFTSAYLVRRAGTDWRPVPLPAVLGVNTLVLALSSVAAEVGRRAAAGGRWRPARAGFLAAAALGLAFVGGQLGAWRALEEAGFVVSTLPHSAFFYLLTGVHAVHLVAGLVVLATTLPALRPPPAAGVHATDPEGGTVAVSPAARARMAATFWHFFGALWIYVYALLAFF